MNPTTRVYTENPNHKLAAVRLSDEEYGRAIQALIILCVDAVIVNNERRTIYLTKRRTKPMDGWWWIGGRRVFGKSAEESMVTNFARETGLKLSPDRFEFILRQEYVWKDREQEPQDVGSHNDSNVHTVTLTDEELASVNENLDQTEYDGTGLVEFTREKLVEEQVHPAILGLYDAYFG